MAQSYTTVPTHTTGDYLSGADWNLVAGILNNGLSVVTTQGTYSSTGSNGSAPFFVFFGIFDTTTNSSGEISVTIPGSGFPNGLIYASATPTYYNSSGTNQLGHTMHIDYANSSKSTVVFVHTQNTSTQNTFNSRYNFLAIGY